MFYQSIKPTSPCSLFFPVTFFCLPLAILYYLSLVSVSNMNNDIKIYGRLITGDR